MMGAFDYTDTFNKLKAFTKLSAGTRKPLLEVELNEIQDIQNYRRKLLGKLLFTNGFIDSSTLTNSNNVITLEPCTFIINGDVIEITENMSIEISESTTNVYLAVKEVIVTYEDSLYTDGNLSGGTELENDLVDSRIGEETTRRAQYQVQLTTTNDDTSAVYLTVMEIVEDVLTDSRVISKIDVSHVPETQHNHDDRYYIKSYIDGVLLLKSNTSHTHDDRYYTEDEVTNLLSNKSDSNHNHDDVYYTESEIINLLSGKSDNSHNHNDLYDTKEAITNLLSGKSNTDHIHDSRYYTETEVDTLLSGKASSLHNHDSRYYTEDEVNTALSNKANLNHTHDDRYYTETEVNNLLSNKANLNHTHDDRYYTEDEVTNLLSTVNAKAIKRSLNAFIYGNLSVATNEILIIAPYAMTIKRVLIAVGTAPVGADLVVDINKNGTTIFTTQTNRPYIQASGLYGVASTIEVMNLVGGDILSIDVDQVGSSVAGSSLSVCVVCEVV